MQKISKNRPAYSLLFAFFVMTVIMLVASSTVNHTQKKQDFYNRLSDSQMAYLAGQSSAELGILAMKDFYAGYDTSNTRSSDDYFCQDLDDDDECEAYGNYEVYGKAQKNDNGDTEYYTPIPGTGSAGNPDDCSILDEDKSLDDPCNWNRLLYGQSATIPLYSDDGSGNRLSPAELGLDGWTLKVRTPCINQDDDPEDCERYMFDTDGVIDGEGDSVILWQLLGEDASGNPITVVPNDQTSLDILSDLDSPTYERSTTQNTEIYESLINKHSEGGSPDYIAITSDDAVSTNFGTTELYETDLNYLSMQLDIVIKLLTDDGTSIPYLEWQLVTESDDPVGDTKSIIIGRGYYEGKKDTYYYPFVITRSTTGESTNIYTLSN